MIVYMFPHACKLSELFGPKAFLLENVRGLLRKSFCEVLWLYSASTSTSGISES
jgi:site-specific DNA-cytosine methylase